LAGSAKALAAGSAAAAAEDLRKPRREIPNEGRFIECSLHIISVSAGHRIATMRQRVNAAASSKCHSRSARRISLAA
jgi:hypothetical protein